MAKAKTPTSRAPVTITGLTLLAAIAAGGVTRLTQQEAAEAISAGHIEANTADLDTFNAAAVRLTEAGKAALAASQTTKPAERAKIELDDGVVMPDTVRRNFGGGQESIYPFDTMALNQSFHVAKTAENPDPVARLSSTVSSARVRFQTGLTNEDGTPKMETIERPVYAKDATGKFVKDANDKRIKTGVEKVERQAMSDPSKDFAVKGVGPSDPKGEGARCWRIK